MLEANEMPRINTLTDDARIKFQEISGRPPKLLFETFFETKWLQMRFYPWE
jgi:hypothetical protein